MFINKLVFKKGSAAKSAIIAFFISTLTSLVFHLSFSTSHLVSLLQFILYLENNKQLHLLSCTLKKKAENFFFIIFTCLSIFKTWFTVLRINFA